MRISTIQAFNNSVNGISRNYADLNRNFEQINTCKAHPETDRRPDRIGTPVSHGQEAGVERAVQDRQDRGEEQPEKERNQPPVG
ncbi:hypothetical protein [Pseudomonas aeruginosa]